MKLICGAVRLDGQPLAPGILQAMAHAMTPAMLRPRLSCWTGECAALATLDFSPAADDSGIEIAVRDSGAVLACDVRLDEPLFVDQKKNSLDSSQEGQLAALLDRSGAGALDSVLGDFSLARWNVRKRELTLARDCMGIRPLVYHHVPGKFVLFASFPRALHASGLLARSLAESALLREMLGISRVEETLFHAVSSVKPGSSIAFERDRAIEHTYWRPTLQAGVYRTPEEGSEALRQAIVSAVRSRVTGDAPVATHLSGGLDSSAIAILAARELDPRGQRLLAYQFIQGSSGEPEDDVERPYVRAVLQAEPSIQLTRIVQPQGISFDGSWKQDRVLSDADEDPENQACRLASQQGAQVMLSGWGGDEGATFNGRGTLANALFTAQWTYLRQEFASLQARRGFTPAQIMQGEVLNYVRQEGAKVLRFFRNDSELYGRDLLQAIRPAARRAALRRKAETLMAGVNVRQNQLRLLRGRHLEFRAGNWAEIGAGYGMAFAFPMLDRRVIECALSMPGSWYLREGWKRRPFRDAMTGILPEVIRRRHEKLSYYPKAHETLESRKDEVFARLRGLLDHGVFRSLFSEDWINTLIARNAMVNIAQDTDSQRSLLSLLPLITYGDFLIRETLPLMDSSE